MSIDLSELVSPSHTAVLTMEVQRAVIGDLSKILELAHAAEETGVIPNIARLLDPDPAHTETGRDLGEIGGAEKADDRLDAARLVRIAALALQAIFGARAAKHAGKMSAGREANGADAVLLIVAALSPEELKLLAGRACE